MVVNFSVHCAGVCVNVCMHVWIYVCAGSSYLFTFQPELFSVFFFYIYFAFTLSLSMQHLAIFASSCGDDLSVWMLFLLKRMGVKQNMINFNVHVCMLHNVVNIFLLSA